MLANGLIIAFVSAYCAIVLYGHFLLLQAARPSLLPKPGEHQDNSANLSEPETVARAELSEPKLAA
jgi:hypothetical protein